MSQYFIIPSDDKGNYTWETSFDKKLAIKLAKEYFTELVECATGHFRVDIFPGTEENGPEAHLDPVWSKTND